MDALVGGALARVHLSPTRQPTPCVTPQAPWWIPGSRTPLSGKPLPRGSTALSASCSVTRQTCVGGLPPHHSTSHVTPVLPLSAGTST